MNDELLVNIVDPLDDLPNDQTCLLFLHPSLLPQFLQKLSVGTELQKQIYVFLVLKVSVKRSDVPVDEVELDTQLPCNLAHVLLLTNLLLLHDFHSTEKPRFLMLNQSHLAELPLS